MFEIFLPWYKPDRTTRKRFIKILRCLDEIEGIANRKILTLAINRYQTLIAIRGDSIGFYEAGLNYKKMLWLVPP
ncbi:hypothetical protein D9M69_629110 [compost metagenome]